MPRPSVAQYAYGSCTVIFSAVALLSAAEAASAERAGVGLVAGSCVLALVLGLVVALRVPAPLRAPAASTTEAEPGHPVGRAKVGGSPGAREGRWGERAA
ncbi:hypothetical protein AAH978_11610 [Streptomyces sp. ZYX-F-203]